MSTLDPQIAADTARRLAPIAQQAADEYAEEHGMPMMMCVVVGQDGEVAAVIDLDDEQDDEIDFDLDN